MQEYDQTVNYLSARTKRRPEIGIICGSGLGGLAKSLENTEIFNYENIPGFPIPTVHGHTGELVFGTMGGIECICMRGRFHFYEGNSMEKVVMPVRVMRKMGVKLLIVTNAAGGLNDSYNVGDIMVIQDHFGMPGIAGNHPLRGANDDSIGPRFPAVSDAYDGELQSIIMKLAAQQGLSSKVRANGTYCFVSGPAYESRAESRFLKMIGGDAVGMSTVPEVIAAKHSGMKILGLSLITNEVVIEQTEHVKHASHAEVLEAVESSGRNVESLVRGFITKEQLGHILAALPAYVAPVGGVAHAAPSSSSCSAAAATCGVSGNSCCGGPGAGGCGCCVVKTLSSVQSLITLGMFVTAVLVSGSSSK